MIISPVLCSKPKHMGAQLMGFRPEVSHHPALETFYDGSGGHRSSVIYDNHLLVRPIDCERAFDRSSDEVAVVIVSDNDRQFQLRSLAASSAQHSLQLSNGARARLRCAVGATHSPEVRPADLARQAYEQGPRQIAERDLRWNLVSGA
jgi:hypothetical protein